MAVEAFTVILEGDRNAAKNAMTMLWVLNLADGDHSLLDMAERAGLPFAQLADAAERLRDAGLLTAL